MVRVWDLQPSHALRTLKYLRPKKANLVVTDETPEGIRLCVTQAKEGFSVVDPATGKALHTVPERVAAGSTWPHLSSCGRFLAWVILDKIKIWDLKEDKLEQIIEAPKGTHLLGWSPDSSLLATEASKDGARIWHRNSGKEFKYFPADRVMSVAWNNSGNRLAVADLTKGKSLLQVLAMPEGRSLFSVPLNLPKTNITVLCHWTSKGDRLLVYTPVKTQILDAQTGKELMVSEKILAGRFAWHPDGDCFVSWSSFNGQIKLYQAHTGQELLSLYTPFNGIYLTWSTDGKMLRLVGTTGEEIFDASAGFQAAQVKKQP